MEGYSLWNPHTAFSLTLAGDEYQFPATAPVWKKWLPNRAPSAHWYSSERLESLIRAILTEERESRCDPRTVRDFVSRTFDGFTRSDKTKKALEWCGLSRAYLHHLIDGEDLCHQKTAQLLEELQEQSRPVKPKALGVIGEKHFRTRLALLGVSEDSIRYRKRLGTTEGKLPYVLETACGIFNDDMLPRRIDVGLNWSALLNSPTYAIQNYLHGARVDSQDPCCIAVHLSCPQLEFSDRAKSTLILPGSLRQALANALEHITAEWTRTKKTAEKISRWQMESLKQRKTRDCDINDAAYQIMAQAYQETSDNGRYPANARQIMYKARPLVLALTGGKCWKNSSYFTQRLLPNYMREHPDETADWDVVFDARGRLVEPHTGHRIDLGTLQVRGYIEDWHEDIGWPHVPRVDWRVPTRGPANRYRYALFIEKEGFGPLLEDAQIAERFGIMIMSTKGMSVTACRMLVERLSVEGVTILVARDFDKAGFSIVHTLRSDTRRYQYTSKPNVIDIGLRLKDVQEMHLDSERVEYGRPQKSHKKKAPTDPRENLRSSGATEEECAFLVRLLDPAGFWAGERVELNAMSSPQFIAWLERKLVEHGVAKVIPDADTLEQAWRRMRQARAIEQALNKLRPRADVSPPPADLQSLLEQNMRGNDKAWDEVLWELAGSSG
jgi:hypothetical protein